MIRNVVLGILSLLAVLAGGTGLVSFRRDIVCHERHGKLPFEAQGPLPGSWMRVSDGWVTIGLVENRMGTRPPHNGFEWGPDPYPWSHGGAVPHFASRANDVNGIVVRWQSSDHAVEMINAPGPVVAGSWNWSQVRTLSVSVWGLLVVFGTGPVVAFIRGPCRRHRRRRRGLCLRCGYDLTGNLTGICPECGCATSATRA